MYLPFAILFSIMYVCGAIATLTSKEQISTDNVCVDGLGRATVFFSLNLMNAIVGTASGYGLRHENCIEHDSWLYLMSRVGFWLIIVIMSGSTLIFCAELARTLGRRWQSA